MAHSTPQRPRGLLLSLLLLAAIAFGTDLADAIGETIENEWFDPEAWMVVLIDYTLLGLLLVKGARTRAWLASRMTEEEEEEEEEEGQRFGGLDDPLAASPWTSFVPGAVLLIGLDVVYYGLLDSDAPAGRIVLGWFYVVALLALLFFVLGGPLRIWKSRHRAGVRRRLESLLAALPLVVAVGFVYTGQNIFGREFDDVHQQYFAQMSQVIPLLLVALGLEGRYLRVDFQRDPVRWTISLYVILALVIGEALAISALPVDNAGELLYPWHEYAAFSATLYAAAVALAAIVILLLGGPGDDKLAKASESGPAAG